MLAGIMTEPQLEDYAHGEQILDLSKYLDWINANTITT
jgi:hypothetical protein